MTLIHATPSPVALLSIHGHSVRLRCSVPTLHAPAENLLAEFAVDAIPDSAAAPEGIIRPYDPTEVIRRLPPAANRLSAPGDIMELYEKDDRFWLIDDRWGMAEINILRATWRSWVLPQPAIDPVRTVELSILWPMAQLLRPRGLCLLPAASLVRDGWGVLIISPIGIEPELTAMLRAGYRILGQSWTALREDDGHVTMLNLPGQVERESVQPNLPLRMRPTLARAAPSWIDLTREFVGSSQTRAICAAVVAIERGRRPVTLVRPVARGAALSALRRCWPIVELHPHRRAGALLAAVSRQCRVYEMRLSRNPSDILRLLDDVRHNRTPASQVETSVMSRTRRVVA